MPIKSLYILVVAFLTLIIIAIYSFINPGAKMPEYDICDYNHDGIVETNEIWQCNQDGNIESMPLKSES